MKVLVIDTVNQLQDNLYTDLLFSGKKADYDEWRDYGAEILHLVNVAKDAVYPTGGEIIDVLGREGTGKTVGTRTLNPDETIYANVDGKPLSYPGAKSKYVAGKNLIVPKSYEELEAIIIQMGAKALKNGEPFYILMLWQLEEFKSGTSTRERKKVLGKMATKFNINGNVIHTYYTKVVSGPTGNIYSLDTQNNGFNTARSPMEMWDKAEIPNDYQAIINRIQEYEKQ